VHPGADDLQSLTHAISLAELGLAQLLVVDDVVARRRQPGCQRRVLLVDTACANDPVAELLAAAPQIAASTGSACHSGTRTPSPVLTAMGLPARRSLGALRLSLGRWTTPADIDTAAQALAKAATV
jgi:cysteine sulfinate desulfinase/cysteine desulfurase-like protein